MTPLAACTIVAHNYLPMARIVARSFLAQHPEATFYVVVVDHPLRARLIDDEQFHVVAVTDIDFGPEGFANMATMYDVTEFSTSVKPFVLRQLLTSHDCVLYLDPDTFLHERLDPLIDATIAAGWSITPHCLQPIPQDGTSPTEREIMQSGVYNLGYIGVTRDADDFLQWWSQRLRRHCISDPEQQLFTDQRWIDLAVPIFSPHIERSPAYNVAYWNIDQRRLWHDGQRYMVDDEPLRFFHFSGYDPDIPYWLSKYFPGFPRVLLSQHPALAALCSEYRDELLETRDITGPALPYGWADAFPGIPLFRGLRRMYRAEVLNADRLGAPLPPSPFSPGGAARFRRWLLSIPAGSIRCMPRYLAAVYDERSDVRAAFPEAEHGDLLRFNDWVERSGRADYPMVRILADSTDDDPWDQAEDAGRSSDGIDLIGYLQAELGVGEAGRLASTALAAAGVSVSTISFDRTLNRQTHPFESHGVAAHDVVLVAVNADQIGVVRREFGGPFFSGRYVVGQWFWELDEFPAQLHPSFAHVNEVWAATEHIRASVAKHAPEGFAVVHMPLPLIAPAVRPDVLKSTFGLDDRFTFLFTFDLWSVFDRKNPLGVVEAFMRAFHPGEGPQLLVKVINGQAHPKSLERLRWAAMGRADITILDQYLDHDLMGALTQACDCYVSLHRAEGLGLTMSEAMTLGKPVIATAYSGNMDFMTEETAALVPWTPTAVGPDCAPYSPHAIWAEPDLDAAAAAMRRLAGDPTYAERLGLAGQRDLHRRFSETVTGERMRKRLTEIRRTHHE